MHEWNTQNTNMTDSEGFMKVPTDEEAKRVEEVARKSQKNRRKGGRWLGRYCYFGRRVLTKDVSFLVEIYLRRLDPLIRIQGTSCGRRQYVSIAKASTWRSHMMEPSGGKHSAPDVEN